jgi:hypothetical protein
VLDVVESTVIDFIDVVRDDSGGQTGLDLVGFGVPEREVVVVAATDEISLSIDVDEGVDDSISTDTSTLVVKSDISSVVLRFRTSIDEELRVELSTFVDIVVVVGTVDRMEV